MVNALFWKWLVASAAAITIIGAGYGCGQKTSSITSTTLPTSVSTSTTTALSVTTSPVMVQQDRNLAIVFHALITFSINPNTSYATDLAVPAVPITWTGLLFSGNLQESGPGEDITDNVGGTISADGTSLITLVYSRKILRTNNTGTSYDIALHNVPLDTSINNLTFRYSGAVIQSYVSSISYADGTVNSGQIVSSNNYVSTDWANTQNPPTLTLTFGK
jgi:hypothetical protein